MDAKFPLLYLIIIAMITFFYADHDSVDHVKHMFIGLATSKIHGAAE